MFLKTTAALAVVLALGWSGVAHAAAPPRRLYVDTTLGGRIEQDRPPFRALWIDGMSYGSGSEANPDTFVKLDEHTLGEVATGTHDAVKASAGTITIGTWENVDVPFSAYRSGSAIWVGTTEVALNGSDETFSPQVGNAATRLRGWLQAAPADEHAAWVDSDMVQLKTRLPTNAPRANTMEVGDRTLTQTLRPGQSGGWQLVALDHNGTPLWNQLFPLTGNATADANEEDHLASVLKFIAGGETWALQAFGDVPAVPASSKLATTLQQFGGRADVVDRFNGAKDSTGGVYALISGRTRIAESAWSPGFHAAEASVERTHTAGSLSALLIRDATENSYVPFNSDSAAPDPAGSSRYSLLPLAYSPPASWADWVRTRDGGRRAPTATERIAYGDLLELVKQLRLVPSEPLCPAAPDAIRAYYCDTSSSDLSSLNHYITGHGFDFDAGTARGRYSADDWNAVRASIEAELADVEAIRGDIAHYQALFGTANAKGDINSRQIGDAVKAAIKSSAAPTTANLKNVLGAMSTMSSVMPGAGAFMTYLSGAFGLMSNFEPDTDPNALLDQVQVKQDDAAAIFSDRMQQASTALSRYGDYLVSDPRKLQEGAIYFRTHNPPTTGADSDFVVAGTYAARQFLWGTLLATKYTIWTSPSVLRQPLCQDGYAGHGGFDPFSNVGSAARWVGPDGDSLWFPAFQGVKEIESSNGVGLPKSATDPLFAAPDPRHASPTDLVAGAVMPYFALDYLPFAAVPVAPNYAGPFPAYAAGCYVGGPLRP